MSGLNEHLHGVYDLMNIEEHYINPSAIKFFKKNPNMIYWDGLMQNPSIFELDKDALDAKFIFHKELMEKAWHPNRVMDWCLSMDELENIN